MFSSSLAASATSADDTGITCRIACRYNAVATSPLAASIPPTSFGIVCVLWSFRPGSSRSGENARKKSVPH